MRVRIQCQRLARVTELRGELRHRNTLPELHACVAVSQVMRPTPSPILLGGAPAGFGRPRVPPQSGHGGGGLLSSSGTSHHDRPGGSGWHSAARPLSSSVGIRSHCAVASSIERLARSRTSAGVIRLEPESGMDTVPPFQSKAPGAAGLAAAPRGGAKVTVRKDALLAQSMGPTLGPLGASVEALRRTPQAQCETERRGRTALRRRWVAKGSPNPRRVRPLDVIPPLRSLQTFARRPVTAETTPGTHEHGI
jgi:hypothetical protein